ncbi:MAG: metallophosphoesterase family protein [Desulfuromonadales bacterium]|nr:metallophosphoesterase family protein [Desulfuromonadales bacterium]
MSKAQLQIDLGHLDGTVMLFGGPYSNLAATRAMRARADALGIPAERTLCTGDVVAYCAQPEETVAMIRDWGIAVVQGNCEESLGWGAKDCGCGFDEGTTCSLLSVDWYRFANERISEEDRAWMRDLPESIRFTLNGKIILVVHGGVRQNNRFIFPSSAVAIKQAELDLAGTDILIGGHSGIPSGVRIEERVWLNTGAIGLPANDGTPDGWYLLLTPEGDSLICRWQRLSYPVEETVTAMQSAGLVSGYMDTLQTGLWPSMDVLPESEREVRGQPILLDDLIV